VKPRPPQTDLLMETLEPMSSMHYWLGFYAAPVVMMMVRSEEESVPWRRACSMG